MPTQKYGYGNTPYGQPMNDISPNTGAYYNYAAPYTAHQEGIIGDTTMNANKSATINQMAALNPAQVQLQNALIAAYMGGGGEFGLGAGMKQANATMERAAAARGIDPRSGVTQSLLARMMSEALAQDSMNRQQYGMNLMTQSPAYYNALQLQLGKQQGSGFGDFAGNVIGTGVGALVGGYGSALGNKWGG